MNGNRGMIEKLYGTYSIRIFIHLFFQSSSGMISSKWPQKMQAKARQRLEPIILRISQVSIHTVPLIRRKNFKIILYDFLATES